MKAVKGVMLTVLLMLCCCNEVVAKKRCKPQLEKLQKIQTMQRHGYSLKRGQSLRKQEDKARKRWWQCEHSTKRSASTKNNKKGKKRKDKSSKVKYKSLKQNLASSPFNSSQPIVIKSKYHGNKKQAWLSFYQQPKQCQRPKNLTIFAFCSEDKQKQRLSFEQNYQP